MQAPPGVLLVAGSCLVALCWSVGGASSSNMTSGSLGVLQSTPAHPDELAAIQLAVEHINADAAVLPSYLLRLVVYNYSSALELTARTFDLLSPTGADHVYGVIGATAANETMVLAGNILNAMHMQRSEMSRSPPYAPDMETPVVAGRW